jgi:hypothetical protein
MTATPGPSAEWWTTSDVATYLGLKVATVSAYRARGRMPDAGTRHDSWSNSCVEAESGYRMARIPYTGWRRRAAGTHSGIAHRRISLEELPDWR